MRGQQEAVAAAQECPNIYLETCSSFSEHGAMEFLVNGAGEDRVVFGSDMPLIEPRHQIAKITTANLSDEAKSKVLGLNAIKLLGLDE
jgi:predicted TIM-barrel fold metal-dependent hydrolase